MADFKPSKRGGQFKPVAQNIQDSPVSQCDSPEQVSGLGGGTALKNYLNDMKAGRSSRRISQDRGRPSVSLQKMNDMKVKLGSELRDESRERSPPSRSSEPHIVPLSARSAEEEQSKMFARKRRSSLGSITSSHLEGFERLAAAAAQFPSEGDTMTMSSRSCSLTNTPREHALLGSPRRTSLNLNILNHDEAYVSSARSQREESLKRSQRLQLADSRSEELNQHMQRERRDSRIQFEQFKARGQNGTGVSSPKSLFG